MEHQEDQFIHLRLMGGPPMPHNECGGLGDYHTEDVLSVTCEKCKETAGFFRIIDFIRARRTEWRTRGVGES